MKYTYQYIKKINHEKWICSGELAYYAQEDCACYSVESYLEKNYYSVVI